MDIQGIDTVSRVSAVTAKRLKAMGIDYVQRYCSPDTSAHPTKCITNVEAGIIRGSGLALGLIWEKLSALDSLRGNGKLHAQAAMKVAKGIGYGPGSALEWCADYDLDTVSQIEMDYAGEWDETVKAEGFRATCYGRGSLLKALKDAGLIHWAHLPESTGWNGYEVGLGLADMIQHVRKAPLAGLEVDTNTLRRGFSPTDAGLYA